MKFLHSFKKFAILEKRIKTDGDIILPNKPSVFFSKLSQPARTTFETYLNYTGDDVKQKMLTYINGEEDKSIKMIQYCIDLFVKNGDISGTNPNYAYASGKTELNIADAEPTITLDDIDDFLKKQSNTGNGEAVTSSTVKAKGSLNSIDKSFLNNGFEIDEAEKSEYCKKITELMKYYHTSQPILIEASCSTLRNTKDSENMTWLELSDKRANSIKELVELCKGEKTPKYNINTKGTNGDGTSGMQSPFENLTPAKDVVISTAKKIKGDGVKKYYELFGYDSKYWKSASKEKPTFVITTDLKNASGNEYNTALEEYKKYQYVRLTIPLINIPDDFTVSGVVISKDGKNMA